MPAGIFAGAKQGRSPLPADIRGQLDRILTSAHFEATARRKRFLQFLVEETLAGRADRLKGFTIAVEVFGRNANFDPQNDPIVRLEAMRLRRDLEHYYLAAGQQDPLHLSIPKGSYAPDFAWLTARPEEGFAKPVERLADPPAETAPAIRPPSRSWLVWGGAVGFAIVVAVGTALIAPKSEGEPVSSAASAVPTVVVNTFESVGGDPAQNVFAIGMTEQIVSDLTRFQGLRVVWARTSLSGDPGVNGSETAKSLFVLDGSVKSIGSSIRVTVRLLDVRAGAHIWSRTFDREFKPSEVFAVQDEIAQRVAAVVGYDQGVIARAGWAAAERKPPASLSAYECVLRASLFQRAAIPTSEFGSVRACLENAVKIEPSYSDAWAMLSMAYAMETRLGFEPRPWLYDAPRKAIEAAQTAIELDPRSSRAFIMLANAYFDIGDMSGFQSAADMAVQLNPHDPIVLIHVGQRLAFKGEWERGIALVERAVALSNEQTLSTQFVSLLYSYHKRDYKRALTEAKRINAPTFYWVPMARAMILGQLGLIDEAKVEIVRLLELKPDIRSQFKNVVRPWSMPDTDAAHMADGLLKAGLQVEWDPPGQAQAQ